MGNQPLELSDFAPDSFGCGSEPFGIPLWLVGEFTTHFRTYLSGDWDVHWGYGISTHGHFLGDPRKMAGFPFGFQKPSKKADHNKQPMFRTSFQQPPRLPRTVWGLWNSPHSLGALITVSMKTSFPPEGPRVWLILPTPEDNPKDLRLGYVKRLG